MSEVDTNAIIEAMQKGLKQYTSVKPCIKCGSNIRSVCNRSCFECKRVKQNAASIRTIDREVIEKALASNSMVYTSSVPCGVCHGTKRYSRGARCVTCFRTKFDGRKVEMDQMIRDKRKGPPPILVSMAKEARARGETTFESPDHPCIACGGITRYSTVGARSLCVACGSRRSREAFVEKRKKFAEALEAGENPYKVGTTRYLAFEARIRGEKKFECADNPCSVCGSVIRYTSNFACIDGNIHRYFSGKK